MNQVCHPPILSWRSRFLNLWSPQQLNGLRQFTSLNSSFFHTSRCHLPCPWKCANCFFSLDIDPILSIPDDKMVQWISFICLLLASCLKKESQCMWPHPSAAKTKQLDPLFCCATLAGLSLMYRSHNLLGRLPHASRVRTLTPLSEFVLTTKLCFLCLGFSSIPF